MQTIVSKLGKVEKNILADPIQNAEAEVNSESVLELLESVSEGKFYTNSVFDRFF